MTDMGYSSIGLKTDASASRGCRVSVSWQQLPGDKCFLARKQHFCADRKLEQQNQAVKSILVRNIVHILPMNAAELTIGISEQVDQGRGQSRLGTKQPCRAEQKQKQRSVSDRGYRGYSYESWAGLRRLGFHRLRGSNIGSGRAARSVRRDA